MQRAVDRAAASTRLFLAGVRSALGVHHCVVFFVLDTRILELTLRCLVLNGVVFLGSIAALRWAVMPALRSLLAALLPARLVGPAAGAAVQAAWLLPAYATCLVLNLVWCKEIAELTARAAQRRAQQREADRKRVALPPPGGRPGQPPLLQRVCRPGAVELASQEAYKALLLAVVLLQVPAVGRLPVAGPALSAALTAWLYALYCFDYKWALHGVPLHLRLRAVEEGWAFFLGFGVVVVLPAALTSFYVGAALAGMSFPLFVIVAADCDVKEAYRRVAESYRSKGRPVAFRRLPVFGVAVAVTNTAVRALRLVRRL